MTSKALIGGAIGLLIYTVADWFIRYQLDKRFPLPR